MERLNYYTNDTYNIKDLEKFDTFQHKYMINNLKKTFIPIN